MNFKKTLLTGSLVALMALVAGGSAFAADVVNPTSPSATPTVKTAPKEVTKTVKKVTTKKVVKKAVVTKKVTPVKKGTEKATTPNTKAPTTKAPATGTN